MALPAESENEVCFVTYYDYSDRVPEAVRLPCPEAYGGASRECFGYSSILLAQDPQSHHAIIESYIPAADNQHEWDPKNEVWKNWQCLDGAQDRQYQREDLTIFNDIFSMGTIPPFTSQQACATFTLPVGSRLLTLSSHTHKYGSDFRIWYPPNDSCIGGPSCEAPDREPDYRSFSYQDPLYQRFDESNPLELDSPDERDRTFRYCAIWDNGATDPQAVRKHSNRPDANTCSVFEDFTGVVGQCGCEPEDRACLGGPNQGMICNGDDSVCSEGGVCDACPVWGGVTTEEEMFAILGAYYVIN